MSDTRTNTPPPDGAATTADARLCNADRMQRRHCTYFHEETGRCTQSGGTTWQERAARAADRDASVRS